MPANVPLLDLVAQYQSIKEDVLAAMMAVVERQGFIMGPEVGQLEAEIARLSGTRHGIACASGTDALLLPLKALDLQPGDEVITTPFTFFATAGTIHNAAASRSSSTSIRPRSTFRPKAIEAAITPRTRAIVVVHLFGQMAAMEEIGAIASAPRARRDRRRRAVDRGPPEDRRTVADVGRTGHGRHALVLSRPRTWARGATEG